jgi:hypothetical protein
MKSRSLRRLFSLFSSAALVATFAVATLPATALAAPPTGTVVFDNTAAALPPNLPSVGYEATSTSEWGTQVTLAGSQRALTKVVVTMSDWALNSSYPGMPADGWTHPITLNLYAVSGTAPGALLKTVTQTFTIPWRPEPDGCGGSTTAYTGSNASCYNGKAFNITFDLNGQGVVAPDSLIFGIAYNTSDYGAAPLRASAPNGGPYDSLNVATFPGTGDGTTATQPSVGTFPHPLGTYLDSDWPGAYGDGGATTGTFRFDSSSWGSFQPAAQFTAAPVCTPTGFVRDSIDLTAAQIGGAVTGNLDATGCNIGAYFDAAHPGSVTNANIHGANYYGVVVNAATVNVASSTIHDIGESPLNGSQHGVGVLYTTNDVVGASTTGTLSGTTITKYQKNGVVVSGTGANVKVLNNTVTGEGKIAYIAQNGIQISFGASATVKGNASSGNWYTPSSYIACGFLLYQAGGVSSSSNNFHDNERNQCNFGKGGGTFKP